MGRRRYRRTQPRLAAGEVTIEELATMVGLKPRALRIWMKAGVLPRGARRGRYLGYGEAIQLRARAAAVVVRRARTLEDAARALEDLDEAGLRELAGLPPVEAPAAPPDPPPAPAIEGLATAGQADPQPPPSPPNAEPEPSEAATPAEGADWRSIPLVPGLELRVRHDASALVQRIAESIARGDWL